MGKQISLREAYEKVKKDSGNAPDNRLTALEKSIADYGSGWHSKDDTAALNKKLHFEKMRAMVQSNDELLKKLNEISDSVANQSNLYSKFKTADEYKSAVKTQGYADKYKNYTYQQISDFLSSDSYNVKRRRGIIGEEEANWLKNQLYSLATSAELEERLKNKKKLFAGNQDNFDVSVPLDKNKIFDTEGLENTLKSAKVKNEEWAKSNGYKDYNEYLREYKNLEGEIEVLNTVIAQKKKQEAFDKKWGTKFNKFKQGKTSPSAEQTKIFEGAVKLVGEDEYFKHLTKDEKDFAASLTTGESANEALEYYKDLIGLRLDAQYNQELMQDVYDFSSQNALTGILGSLASIPLSLASGVEYAGSLLSGQTDKRNRTTTLSQGFREGTKSQWDSEFWDFVYDTTMSGVDSVAAAGLSAAVPFLGEALLGGSAAAATYNDALDRGVSGGDAILSSLTAGVAESLFEHISIGKILDAGDITKGWTKAGLKQAVNKTLADTAINFTEEALTEVSNIVTDNLINGELSSYAIAVKDYYMQGVTPEEAKSKAATDLGIQVAMAGASGALMGSFFGAGGSVKGLSSSQFKNSHNGGLIKANGNIGELKTMANLNGVIELKNAAEKLTENSKPSEIGYVFNSLLEHTVENSVKQMTPVLLEHGAKEGGSNSAKGWALQMARSIFDNTKNSESRKTALITNKVTSDVYTEFIENGKYGGDTLLALKELASNPQSKAMTADDFGNSQGVESDSIFDEPNISEDNTSSQTLAEKYYKVLTKEQAYVKEVGAKLGRKVVFEHTKQKKGFKSDGYIDKNGIIHIDYAIKNPLQFIFKHELTHFLEKSKFTYSDFANAVMDSESFSEWVKSNGYESVENYRTSLIDLYSKIDSTFDEPKANKEMLANFVGEKLFGNDLASLEKLLMAMEPKQRRTFMEFIKDFIKYLKEKFIKDTSLTAQIEKFEKQFIEAYRAAESELEQQKTAENNGGEEFSLDMYSEHQKFNWSRSSKIVVYESDVQLMDFVERAMSVPEYKAKMYFGMVGEHLAKRIQADTGLSLLGRNVTLRADNVKKVLKPTAHGDSAFEQNRGQEAVKKEDFCKIPIVISEPDTIKRSTDDYKGKPAVIFEKTIDNQKITIVAVDSGGSLDLFVQTMYLGKKKGNIADMLNGQTSEQTSETSVGTVPNNNVPQKSTVVNNNISQNTSNDTDSAEFLYVGEKSKTADKLKLSTAKQMLKDGADSETIRKETGWFKGYDSKWRFEISDKDFDIDKESEFVRYLNIITKSEKTKEEAKEFFSLSMKYFDDYFNSKITLDKLIKHDLLFKAYPELKNCKLAFTPEKIGYNGGYTPKSKTITLPTNRLGDLKELKSTLIHEIQHAVQEIEGFTKGASGVYWEERKYNGEVFLDKDGNEISSWDLYLRTAGEIEARDAASRIDKTDKERKNTRPDIDRKDVIFADKELVSASENVQYSIPSDHNYVYTDGKASFTEERLNNLFDEHSLGDGKRAEHSNAYVGYISPEDFVNLTANKNIRGRVEDEAYVLNEEELRNETETPFIEYDPASGEVVNHEGRHRMVALKADGITKVAVLIKPYTDSFERRTPQDISLTGQSFAEGRASGSVTVKSAVPLSEKYRTEAVTQFAQNPDADVRYSLSMEDADTLLDMYEHKQITREEYLSRLNQSRNRKAETPLDIARRTKEDANTTPPLKRKQGEAKGDSESKLYTSLQKSDIFNDEFKAEFKNDSFIKKYQSVGNAETMREAAKELDAGGQAYVLAWSGKDAKHASLIDIAVGFILLDRYQRIGDKESAAAVGEKLREMATASGQQVQIFSILGRFDADSMVLYAQMELSKAFKVFADEKTERWAKNNADRFNLTDSDVEFIRRRTFQAAEMPENSREKAVLLGEIAARVQDKLPPNKGQAYKALQRICMLLNPKTLERNIIGNATITPVFIASDYFGTAIDKIVSLKTGVRTTGAFKVSSVKEFGKGIYESYDDFKRHIHTKQEQLNRFEVGGGKSFNENHRGLLKPINTISKILNAADRLTSFCLEVGDRPFYEMWFINSLNNQMRLNNVIEATPEMVEIATEEALERTWQNDNYMTKAATGARTFLNYLSYPVYKVFGVGLGDVFIKFTKTPANLAKALIDFSPVSIAKVGYDAIQLKNAIEKGEFDATLQKKLVNDISKSIMGILAMILTAALSEMGALTGGGDDDKDLAYFEKNLAGKAPYSVIIGDTSVSYEWLQPISGLVAMVTDYMKSAKENPENEWYDNLKEAFKAGGTVLFNQSFMKNIQQLFSSDDIFGNLWDGILSEPSVFVPQILSQTASAMDEYSRDTYENDNLQTALNKVKVKIPGLRETLPKSVDTLGNEMENQRYGILNSFFNPANVYPENSGAVADEVYGLYKSTGDATVIPRKAPYNLTVKGVKHTFGTEERAEFQKVVGATSNDIIENLLNERDYEDLLDSQKIELITTVYNYATAKAKSNVIYSYDIISAMYGGNISEDLYNRLTEAEKKKLSELYFMDDYYDSKYKPKFEQGEEAEYFLEKLLDKYGKEENQSKKDKYKQKELNKILN